MTRTKNTTESHLRKRRSTFQKSMDDLENSNVPLKRSNIIEMMHDQGYPDYTIDKYYVDWAYIARENTFVRSLTEGAYSKIIQDIYSKLLEYLELVSDWQKNPPKIYRQTAESRKSGEDPRVTRSVAITISPIVIANLGLKIQ